MEKEIRDRLLASCGFATMDLVRQYCRETVVNELWELLYEAAEVVFWAARDLKDEHLMKFAANNIIESAGYSPEVKKAASVFLNELSMR